MRKEPAHSIIKRLGGIHSVSRAVGLNRQGIWKWTQPREKGGTGGTIPQRHHIALLDLARSLDLPLTPADFLPLRAGTSPTSSPPSPNQTTAG